MIQLCDITIRLQETIISDFNGSFESGLSYLIEGNNGVGKTTLLKLIAGKIQPRQGSIHYDFIDDDLDWDEHYNLRKKFIHFIPTHALHELISTPELFYQQRYYAIENSPLPTVRDYFGERLKNLTDLQLPDSFQLHHLLELELTRLSNGQVKKIIILKQLLDSIPKVLILDYPFEGLDKQSRIELSEFLDYLAKTYNVQLIIADNEHSQLPQAIIKRVIVQERGLHFTDRVPGRQVESTKVKSELISQESAPVVEMQEVTIRYGDSVIINKLNWMIRKGERWALTGRNGSGKTTLFSMIYADHPMAYSEKVFLFGKRRGSGESIWDIKKRISYLGPEQVHFLDYATEQLTVLEYLKKIKTAAEKFDILIANFQIELLLPKRLRQLSNGQLQLILLIALFLSPKELLLLDEPFQFLDLEQKERVTAYLHSSLEELATMVLITHYEDDVNRWTHHRLSL